MSGVGAEDRAPVRGGGRGRFGFVALLAVMGLATVFLAVVGDGNLVAPLVPVLLAAILYGAFTLPLRWTVSTLLFVTLAADGTKNAGGLWHTPWAVIGDLLTSNLDAVVPAAKGMKLNGLELANLLLLGVGIYRRSAGSRLDPPKTQTASVVGPVVMLCLAGTFFSILIGYSNHGSPDVMIWQTRPMVEGAALFFLLQHTYGGAADRRLLTKIIVAAAWVKAAIAVYVRYRIAVAYTNVEFTTSHGDSVLFVMACVIPIAHLLEQTDGRRLRNLLVIAPLVLWGILANTRRLAWVELAFVLGAFYLISPARRWKVYLTRAALIAVPIAIVYVSAGWNSNSRIFGPVQLLRSVSDTKKDRSAWDREVEDYNLAVSTSERPLLGRGFGTEYSEYIKGDDISRFFPMFRTQPHNMVLGLLLFAGALPFFAIWLVYPATAFLAARAYRLASTPEQRAAALSCIGCVLVVCVQCFGDMGLYSTQSKLVTALALAVAGKLAVETGAWPRRFRRSRATQLATTLGADRLEPSAQG